MATEDTRHNWPKAGDWHHRGYGVFARVVQCGDRGCAATKSETKSTYLRDGEERVWSQSTQVSEGSQA